MKIPFSKLLSGITILTILSVLLLLGCNNQELNQYESSIEESKEGGLLKIGLGPISGNIKNLGYVGTFRGANELFAAATSLETLTRLDESGEVVPWLAESWEVDADNKIITFILRKDVKFHDGTDFNAEAVKWNIELAMQAKSVEFEDVQSVDVIDEHTVLVKLKEWNSSMLGTFASYLTIFSPSAADKNGGKDWMMENLVGTGPFQFEKLVKDVGITFKKFNGYWQPGKPKLDAVEFKIYQDEMSLEASFQANEIDVIFAPTLTTAKNMETVGEIVHLESGLGSSLTGIITSSKDPNSPFHDVRVRKALGYAIDAKSIMKAATFGYAVETNQYGSSKFWSYNPDVKGTPYDPKKAKELLVEAGFPNGFKTTIFTDVSYMDTMTAVQEYLSKVGIEANIDIADPSRMQQMVSPEGSWDGIIVFNPRAEPDVALYMPRYFSENATRFGANIIHPDEITILLNEAKMAKDQEAKKRIANELQKNIFDEYALATPFWMITMPSVTNKKVQNSGINVTHATAWTPEETSIQK